MKQFQRKVILIYLSPLNIKRKDNSNRKYHKCTDRINEHIKRTIYIRKIHDTWIKFVFTQFRARNCSKITRLKFAKFLELARESGNKLRPCQITSVALISISSKTKCQLAIWFYFLGVGARLGIFLTKFLAIYAFIHVNS